MSGTSFSPPWCGSVTTSEGSLRRSCPPDGTSLRQTTAGIANLILNLPDDLSAKRDEIEQRATRWLTSRFGYDWGEWQYCTFKPKLFLEEFIDFNGVQTPDDCKFYCFRGKALSYRSRRRSPHGPPISTLYRRMEAPSGHLRGAANRTAAAAQSRTNDPGRRNHRWRYGVRAHGSLFRWNFENKIR